MADANWPELGGKELRYQDHTWELTGEVTVRRSGNLLAVAARQVDDVRHESATLYFDLVNPPDSLNPGALGEHFDRLEPDGDDYHLVVRKGDRTYRYELQRLEYE